MLDQNTNLYNGRKTMRTTDLRELVSEATDVASLLEGLDVLNESAHGPAGCEVTKRARNALAPAIETVIARAWALAAAIEKANDSAAAPRASDASV